MHSKSQRKRDIKREMEREKGMVNMTESERERERGMNMRERGGERA